MSYIKPNLTEYNITKLIADKLENKKNKIMIENQIKEQELIQINNIPDSFYKKIYIYVLDFLKDNIILIIIITLISILLYVRYIEIKKRKEQMKEIIEKINEES
jgi:hypothetical protein